MDMMLDAAVIGCGRMGAFTSASVRRFAPPCWLPLAHAEAVRSHPELRLAALCDSQADTLERAAREYRVTRCYLDPKRLFDEVRPALAGIATRTIGRSDILAHAISAGTGALHVEKPLCNSMRELAILETLFGRSDVFVSYGAIRRLLAPYRAALEQLRSGRWGELMEVQVNLGRSALYWTHPHSVDLLLFATGGREVESVSARLSGVVHGALATEIVSDPIIDSASLWFADGVEGRISRSPGADLLLSCANGQILVEGDGRAVVSYAPEGDDPYPARRDLPIVDAATAPGGTLAAISQLVDCLRGDASARAANAAHKGDILRGQRILFAMVQSHAQGGRPVSLSEVDADWVVLARSGSRYA
jgi:scyllo-inositol 2-dehydrogenase (NAD+)